MNQNATLIVMVACTRLIVSVLWVIAKTILYAGTQGGYRDFQDAMIDRPMEQGDNLDYLLEKFRQ